MTTNLTRRINQVLYMLKRQYGGTINIYQMGDATVDHLTGVKTIPRTVTEIKRAIILPVKVIREFTQTISVISANKTFVMGGTYDAGTRMFIVERKDVPNLDITESDWIIYRNRRYEIKSFEEYEFESAWVIVGREIKGDVPAKIFPLCADNLIRVEQASGQTP